MIANQQEEAYRAAEQAIIEAQNTQIAAEEEAALIAAEQIRISEQKATREVARGEAERATKELARIAE